MSHSTLIKICGIKDASILSCAIEAGADFVGFMHFAKSPRHVELHQIGELVLLTPKNINSVVVLVNPDFATLKEVSDIKPDFIQLHGKESAQFVAEIGTRFGLAVIKVLPVDSPGDLKDIKLFDQISSHILLDAKPPKNASRPGGLGEVFDWSLLDEMDREQEYFLSGGLNPENISMAINQVRPFGVDVSSGVESASGVKSTTLIEKFVANVRQADKNQSNVQPF